jgi:hypothetical protein
MNLQLGDYRVWQQSREDLNWPDVVNLGEDRWCMSFSIGRHGGSEWLHHVLSEDRGQTWRDYPEHPGVRLMTRRDGSMFGVRFSPGPQDNEYCQFMFQATSHDHGRTWATGLESVIELWSLHMYPQNPPLELADGSMLLTTYAQGVDAGGINDDKCTVFLERRPGETAWRHKANLFDWKPEYVERPNENSTVQLPSGKMLCVARTGYPDSGMIWAVSDDNASTWTELERLPWTGVDPQFHLLGNGVLLLVFGDRRADKSGQLTAVASTDEGATWSEPLVIYDGLGTSYHSALPVDEKTLLVAYSAGMFRRSALPQFSPRGEFNQLRAVEITATP